MKRIVFILALVWLTLPLFCQTVNIGDILCTDGSIIAPEAYASSGRTAKGIVFYVDETNLHGWAVHLQYQGPLLWSTERQDIPGLNNYFRFREAITDFDGYENTRIIRAAGNAASQDDRHTRTSLG